MAQTARASGGSAGIKASNTSADDRKFLENNRDALSKSTLRAKWVHSPQEHEDRAGQTLATRSRDVIKAWADSRGAQPATTTIKEGERPRTLRFDFPANGQGGESEGRSRRLKPIDWKAWLDTFENRKLVFLFQEHRRNGGDSNFFRLDSPEREEG